MHNIIEEAAVAANLPQTAVTQENNQFGSQASKGSADVYEMLSKAEAAAVKQPPLPLSAIIEAPIAAKPKIQAGMVPVESLRHYIRNTDIYEDREDPLLVDSIRREGVLNDLVVTEDGEILGGNRRFSAAKQLGLKEVRVKVESRCKTDDEKMLRVLDDNIHREKTNAVIVREYQERLWIEARAAAARKAAQGKKPEEQDGEGGNLPPAADKEKGKSRDLAAKPLNLSGVTAEKGRKVLEAVAKARAKNMPEIADELLVLLNDKGFHSAYKRARALKLIATGAPKAKKQTTGKAKLKGAAAPAAPEGDNGAIAPAAEAQVDAADVDAVPPDAMAVEEDEDSDVRIITDYIRAVERLEELSVRNLTADQKDNLQRAQDDAQDWFAYNAEAFRVRD